MSITEEQVAEAFESGPPIILAPGPRTTERTAPEPDEVWDLPSGIARIYHGEGNTHLTRPVLIADGFSVGPTDLNLTWELLEYGPFPLLSEIRRRGRDVVLVGYRERSASILENAETAMAAVIEVIDRRTGDHPLTVGGFSMGGLVTRYALAKLETVGIDHQTQLYYSWDSPHTGAWIPIALQAFAHYIKKLNAGFSNQINSPAAQELLSQHIANWEDKAATSERRLAFLRALEEVSNWPRARQTRLIALANGPDTGVGNGIRPGADALSRRRGQHLRYETAHPVRGRKPTRRQPPRPDQTQPRGPHQRPARHRRRPRRHPPRLRPPRRQTERPPGPAGPPRQQPHPRTLLRPRRQRRRPTAAGHPRRPLHPDQR
ncbi:hypothetical protein SCATT_14370 [Streptantibioticus cattleyicolor NRRL 8057 = DSM 46488]|uniref:DUF676 domain-containing protein n=1 Tax=Streptantibioticus cattleyicolor (strain ATCC 35852 / DSM 46488 / JCM 4925 / NBRC 14057 / NRRL 8057) TaxID=1003195 RepID=F8JYQ2_STREN|nr:hypothetical protein SCATT_14370 [Streptantibioticus cattleyicolor NRRL 8057 = DSM 46488]MYS58493.1 alpha/beta hydrolase [Streptomyces sp. SID5468]CCB74154.1 conserved protein of unknown function [Streptantibioticus cattleyicolor NRRL 8057 = DSM 46488]